MQITSGKTLTLASPRLRKRKRMAGLKGEERKERLQKIFKSGVHIVSNIDLYWDKKT